MWWAFCIQKIKVKKFSIENKKVKIAILVILFFIAVPTVSMAGSFVTSLIQGKTPAEAVQIIAEQIDQLFNRVEVLEDQQTTTTQNVESTKLEIERLKLENENLRLKTGQIYSDTEALKVKENAKNQCSDLSKQISLLEAPIRKNYADKIIPLNEEKNLLEKELSELKKGNNNTQGLSIEEWQQQIKENKQRMDELKAKIDAIDKQVDLITDAMQKAIDQSFEIQSLIKRATELLCA